MAHFRPSRVFHVLQIWCKNIYPWSIKHDRICRKHAISSSADPRTPRLLISNMQVHVHICNIYSAYICVYNVVFGGYHSHYRGEYRGKIRDGQSNPIYSVLKLLKLQNSWHNFDRPVFSMYCKYAEYACKLQKNLPMTNNTCHNMQKNAISYYEYVEYACKCKKKHAHDQQKNIVNKKLQNMQKKCNIVCV